MSEEHETYTRWQHEREMTRLEIQCRRWFIAFMVVLIMLFVTNAGWVVYENSFQDVTVEQEAGGMFGNATIYSGTGDVSIGQGETDNPNTGEEGQY